MTISFVGSATQRVIYKKNFSGTQLSPIHVTPSFVLLHGWDMTLIKRLGTDRLIEWSIRKVA